jgi:hypothetical protein
MKPFRQGIMFLAKMFIGITNECDVNESMCLL